MKRFNVTGTCLPKKHYMVDTSKKIKQIIKLIEDEQYFTINRARQYGKTTTFLALERDLSSKYCVIFISFEGICEDSFINNITFVKEFIFMISDNLKFLGISDKLVEKWENIDNLSDNVNSKDPFKFLSKKISQLCKDSDKEIILMIDEVDKTSNNQVFLNFLGMLRDKYLLKTRGKDTSFKSVILAGVHDIKNLKRKIRSRDNSVGNTEDNKKGNYNSPWNIAADFEVDMSFHPDEIATMLREYEADYHTGMDITQISQEIYNYTNGYPYLVSRICQKIDEKFDKDWTINGVEKAANEIIRGYSTLIDDLIKNYENNSELREMINDILLRGQSYSYVGTDPVIQEGAMYGILMEKEGKVAISNVIFETVLTRQIISKEERAKRVLKVGDSQFVHNGRLDMEQVLRKFQELMYTEHRDSNKDFIEQNGRLLFICFIKPIINGVGFYYAEPETRNNSRMDLVVTYGKEEYIIELKIWHGKQYRQDGIKQLEKYLESRHSNRGYLVSFSFNKQKKQTAGMIPKNETNMDIFEIVI